MKSLDATVVIPDDDISDGVEVWFKENQINISLMGQSVSMSYEAFNLLCLEVNAFKKAKSQFLER